MRYSELNILDTIRNTYNDLNTLKFFTYRHAQVNENEHEEVLERWLFRLLNKLKL